MTAIIILFGVVILCYILTFFRLPKKHQKNTVYIKPLFYTLGLAASLLFFSASAVILFLLKNIGLSCGFLAFSLLGIRIMNMCIKSAVLYDESGFTVFKLFGIKKMYSYADITGINMKDSCTYLLMGRQYILIDCMSQGAACFLSYANNKYRSLHNEKYIPRTEKPSWDIFNGHIKSSGTIIFFYVIVTIANASMFLLLPVPPPASVENTVQKEAVFTSYKSSENRLTLYDSNGEAYYIAFSSNDLPYDRIVSVCDGKTVSTVYTDKNQVKAIYVKDISIFGFDEYNALNMQIYNIFYGLCSVLCVMWIMYVCASIIVGRNPRKFKKVVFFFFRHKFVVFDDKNR